MKQSFIDSLRDKPTREAKALIEREGHWPWVLSIGYAGTRPEHVFPNTVVVRQSKKLTVLDAWASDERELEDERKG